MSLINPAGKNPDDVEEMNFVSEWNFVSGREDFVSGRVLQDRYDKILRPSFIQQ
jgi:hypothetical protein